MEILTRAELAERKEEIIERIKQGAVFIYPTDTIYGIGCNALQAESVQLIRELKNQHDSPLSIWIPSMVWLRQNCIITDKGEKWLKKLPGPYTLIFPLKESHGFPSAVMEPEVINNQKETNEAKTIGIRWPNHWFHSFIEESNIPIITTSANRHGEPFMTRLGNLDRGFPHKVEFLIYEGEKKKRPSALVDVETGRITKR